MYFLDCFQGDDPAHTQRRVGELQSHAGTRIQPSTSSSSFSGNAPPFAVFVEKEFEDEARSSAGHVQGGGSHSVQCADEDFQVSPNAPLQ